MARNNTIGNFSFGINYQVNSSGLKQIRQDLQSLMRMDASVMPNPLGRSTEQVSRDLKTAQQEAQRLMSIINASTNTDLGVFNIQKFNQELQKIDLVSMRKNLALTGVTGLSAFDKMISHSLALSQSIKTTNGLINKMVNSLSVALSYTASTAIVRGISSTVSQSIRYVEQLDSALNDIRVVTKKSADEMQNFAKEANIAAQSLGISTKEYVQGSLTFYQQGLNKEEAEARASITAKVANVTGQSPSETANQITSITNSFRLASDEIEPAMDKLAKGAAISAASFSEISDAMQKVSATAATVGVSLDSLIAQVTTVEDVTREAPETIGTAFKTIYARITDLKANGTDEFGVSLGQVSSQLASVGINILDANNDLRLMDDIINDLGDNWQKWSKEQQQAIAIAVAGKRQYVQLEALMNNWDKYQEILAEIGNSAGELQNQQDIFMERTEAHIAQMQTAWENVQGAILDPNSIKTYADIMREIANTIASIISSLGGGKTLFPMILGILTQLASKQIAKGIVNTAQNIKAATQMQQNRNAQIGLAQTMQEVAISTATGNSSYDEQYRRIISLQSDIVRNTEIFTEQEKRQINDLTSELQSNLHTLALAEEQRSEGLQVYNALMRDAQRTDEIISSSAELTQEDRSKIRATLAQAEQDFEDIQLTLSQGISDLVKQIPIADVINRKMLDIRANIRETNAKRQTLRSSDTLTDEQRQNLEVEIEELITARRLLEDELNELNIENENIIRSNAQNINQLLELVDTAQRNAGALTQEETEQLKVAVQQVREAVAQLDAANEKARVDRDPTLNRRYKNREVRAAEQAEIEAATSRLSEAQRQLIGALEQAGMQVDILHSQAEVFAEDTEENLQTARERVEGLGQTLQSLGQEISNIDITSTFINAASSIGNVIMAVSTLQKVFFTFADESVPAGERMTQLFTALLTTVPMTVINIKNMVDSFREMNALVPKLKTVILQVVATMGANTAATSASTVATGALSGAFSAATIAVKGFFTALGPVGWALMAVTAAITTATLILNHYEEEQRKARENAEKARNTSLEQAQKIQESYGIEAEALDTTIKKYKEFSEVASSWGTLESEKAQARHSILELKDTISEALGEEISAIELLTSDYDKLIQRMEEQQRLKAQIAVRETNAERNQAYQSIFDLGAGQNYAFVGGHLSGIESWLEPTGRWSPLFGTIERGDSIVDTEVSAYIGAILQNRLKERSLVTTEYNPSWKKVVAKTIFSQEDFEKNPEKYIQLLKDNYIELQKILTEYQESISNIAGPNLIQEYFEHLKETYQLESEEFTQNIAEIDASLQQTLRTAVSFSTITEAANNLDQILSEDVINIEALNTAYGHFINGVRQVSNLINENQDLTQSQREWLKQEVSQQEQWYAEIGEVIQVIGATNAYDLRSLSSLFFSATEQDFKKIQDFMQNNSTQMVLTFWKAFKEGLEQGQSLSRALGDALLFASDTALEIVDREKKKVELKDFFGFTESKENPFDGWIRGAEDYLKVIKKINTSSKGLNSIGDTLAEKGKLSIDDVEGYLQTFGVDAYQGLMATGMWQNGEFVASNVQQSIAIAEKNAKAAIQSKVGSLYDMGYQNTLALIDEPNQKIVNEIISRLTRDPEMQQKIANSLNIASNMLSAQMIDETFKTYGNAVLLELYREPSLTSTQKAALTKYSNARGAQRQSNLKYQGAISNLSQQLRYVPTAKEIPLNRSPKTGISTAYIDPYADRIQLLEKASKRASEQVSSYEEQFAKVLESHNYITAQTMSDSIAQSTIVYENSLSNQLKQIEEAQRYYYNQLTTHGVSAQNIDSIGGGSASARVIDMNNQAISALQEQKAEATTQSAIDTYQQQIDILTHTNNVLKIVGDAFDNVNDKSQSLKATLDGLGNSQKRISDRNIKMAEDMQEYAQSLRALIEDTNFKTLVTWDQSLRQASVMNLNDNQIEQLKELKRLYSDILSKGGSQQDLNGILDGVISAETVGLTATMVEQFQELRKALPSGVALEQLFNPYSAIESMLQESSAILNAEAWEARLSHDEWLEIYQKHLSAERDIAQIRIENVAKATKEAIEEIDNQIAIIEHEATYIRDDDYVKANENIQKELEARQRLSETLSQQAEQYQKLSEENKDNIFMQQELQNLIQENLEQQQEQTRQSYELSERMRENTSAIYQDYVDGYDKVHSAFDEYLNSLLSGLTREIELQDRAFENRQHEIDLLLYALELQQQELDQDQKNIGQKKKVLDARKKDLQELLREYQERWALEDKDRERQEQLQNRADRVAERAKSYVAASQGDLEALSRVEELDEEIEQIDKELLENLIQDVRTAIEDGINAAIEAIDSQQEKWDEALQKQQEILDLQKDEIDKLQQQLNNDEKEYELSSKWMLSMQKYAVEDFQKTQEYQNNIQELLRTGITMLNGQQVSLDDILRINREANHTLGDLTFDQADQDIKTAQQKAANYSDVEIQRGYVANNSTVEHLATGQNVLRNNAGYQGVIPNLSYGNSHTFTLPVGSSVTTQETQSSLSPERIQQSLRALSSGNKLVGVPVSHTTAEYQQALSQGAKKFSSNTQQVLSIMDTNAPVSSFAKLVDWDMVQNNLSEQIKIAKSTLDNVNTITNELQKINLIPAYPQVNIDTVLRVEGNMDMQTADKTYKATDKLVSGDGWYTTMKSLYRQGVTQ